MKLIQAVTVLLLSGCAGVSNISNQDNRPGGNQGLTIRDQSSERWVYSAGNDPITGAQGSTSTVWSRNTINLPFPYAGEQRAALTVGRTAEGQPVAVIGAPKGQLTCLTGCLIRYRTDSGPQVATARNRGYETTMIYIDGAESFAKALAASQTVTVELPFYGAAPQYLEFKTSNAPWTKASQN